MIKICPHCGVKFKFDASYYDFFSCLFCGEVLHDRS